MKWIYRIFTLILLGGVVAVPFFTKNNQGKPMMSLPGLKDLSPSEITSKAPGVPSERTVYKWKDEQGVWHYGDRPPSEATRFSTLVVNDQTNVIQSTPVPKDEPATPPVEEEQRDNKPGYQPPQTNEDVLTFDRALNIVEDARSVREMMEQRNTQLDTIIGNQEKR